MEEYKFVGEDGSLGLRNGGVYLLEVRFREYRPDILVTAYRRGLFGIGLFQVTVCPYGSMQAFNKNWNKIKDL